jgi:hypothetical protein
VAGKSKPVRESEFFETMSEATRAGKATLAKFGANQAVRVHCFAIESAWFHLARLRGIPVFRPLTEIADQAITYSCGT